MKLYINKKIDFASSHKYNKPHYSDEKNHDLFGRASEGRYGHGHNFSSYFVFSGDVDPKTGMILELSKVKEKIMNSIMTRYDHVFLNDTIDAFHTQLPTPELLSKALLHDTTIAFSDSPITLEACHLKESKRISATAYLHNQSIEKHLTFPHIIHNQIGSIELTFTGAIDPETDMVINEHKHYDALKETLRSTTTIASLLDQFHTLRHHYSLHRMRISLDTTQIDVYNDRYFFSAQSIIYATHQLKGSGYSVEKNKSLFGKCANPHGHDFLIQVQYESDYNNICNLEWLRQSHHQLEQFLDPFQYKSLDEETDLLKSTMCTCESMIYRFKSGFEEFSNQPLSLIRLQETPNNRFTLREHAL